MIGSLIAIVLLATPSYTFVNAGDVISYKAVCFDRTATANMLSEIKFADAQCELKLKEQFAKSHLEFDKRIKLDKIDFEFQLGLREALLNDSNLKNIKLEENLSDLEKKSYLSGWIGKVLVGSLLVSVGVNYFLLSK